MNLNRKSEKNYLDFWGSKIISEEKIKKGAFSVNSCSMSKKKNLSNFIGLIIFWGILFSISFLASLHPLPFVGYYDEKRVLQVFLLVNVSLFVVLSYEFRNYIISFILQLPLLSIFLIFIFFIFGIISSSFARFPSIAYLEVSQYFLFFLLILCIAFYLDNFLNSKKIIIGAFVVAAILYLIAFLAALIAGIHVYSIDFSGLAPGFSNRRFLNQFQSISFPMLLLAPFVINKTKWQYFLLTSLAAFWVMLMLTTAGRGVIIATLISTLAVGFIFPEKRKEWWVHALFVIFLGIVFFVLFKFLNSGFKILDNDVVRMTSSGRLKIWLEAISMGMQNPILGMGPMHFAFIPHNLKVAHPHNIIFQLISEWGIPATLSLFSLILYGFFKWASKFSKTKKNTLLIMALSSSFLASVIHGQVSGVFVMPLSQLGFILICGWMLNIYLGEKNISGSIETKYRQKIDLYHSLLKIFCIIALAGLLNTVVPQLIQINNKDNIENIYLNGNYPARSSPRFWVETFIKAPK